MVMTILAKASRLAGISGYEATRPANVAILGASGERITVAATVLQSIDFRTVITACGQVLGRRRPWLLSPRARDCAWVNRSRS